MASAGGEGEDDARWSLWARGSHSSFSGREDALTLEGDVLDGRDGRGLRAGQGPGGRGDCLQRGGRVPTRRPTRGGEVESTLLSAYPLPALHVERAPLGLERPGPGRGRVDARYEGERERERRTHRDGRLARYGGVRGPGGSSLPSRATTLRSRPTSSSCGPSRKR